jgi:hypothetical protein
LASCQAIALAHLIACAVSTGSVVQTTQFVFEYLDAVTLADTIHHHSEQTACRRYVVVIKEVDNNARIIRKIRDLIGRR